MEVHFLHSLRFFKNQNLLFIFQSELQRLHGKKYVPTLHKNCFFYQLAVLYLVIKSTLVALVVSLIFFRSPKEEVAKGELL